MNARTPLYRQAQIAVKQLIVDRSLRPGDALPSEAELAEKFGMSRLSLREGIKSLESMGIVSSRHGDGLFVAPFSFTPLVENLPYGQYAGGGDLRHLLEAREALEAAMMARLVAVIGEDQLTALDTLAAEMGQTADRRRIADLDQQFHITLMGPLHNPFVTDLVNVFWIMFNRLRDSVPPPNPTSGADLHILHQAIVDALRAGSADLATQAMVDHFLPLRAQLAALD
jgi:DNA-binding FadR family transcriptional regulator